MTPSPGIEPGPQWWETSALPLRQPCSPYLQVYINEQEIEQVKETIFLDVFLDENLSWKADISHEAKKKNHNRLQ